MKTATVRSNHGKKYSQTDDTVLRAFTDREITEIETTVPEMPIHAPRSPTGGQDDTFISIKQPESTISRNSNSSKQMLQQAAQQLEREKGLPRNSGSFYERGYGGGGGGVGSGVSLGAGGGYGAVGGGSRGGGGGCCRCLVRLFASSVSMRADERQFVDYAPLVFRYIRKRVLGLSTKQYMKSILPTTVAAKHALDTKYTEGIIFVFFCFFCSFVCVVLVC